LRGFMKSKNKQILKVTALYVIWNPKSVKCPASISENPVPLCTTCIACKNPVRKRQKIKFKNQFCDLRDFKYQVQKDRQIGKLAAFQH
jgi:hypothetical protein